MNRVWGAVVVACVLLFAGASPSYAQLPRAKGILRGKLGGKARRGQGSGDALQRFLELPPAQQQAALRQLPPARRRQVQQRLRAFQGLSPEEQRVLRGRFQAFSSLPEDRQQAVRQQIRSLRDMSPADQQKALQSPELRNKFSGDELQLLDDVYSTPEQPE